VSGRIVAGVVALVVLVSAGAVALAAPWRDAGATPPTPGASTTAAAVDPSGPPDATPPQVDTATLVAAVPTQAVAKIDPVRLADGLAPPSNRWYSGLVFGDAPQPVYAMPDSFALTATGFEIGAPQPTASAAVIMAPHVASVGVDVGAASAQVVAADPVAVTVALLDGAGKELGRVALAEGSPFVSFTAAQDLTFGAGAAFVAGDGPAPTVTIGATTWALVAPDGALDGGTLTLAAGATATWYPLPTDASSQAADVLAAAAGDPVTGVQVTYGVDTSVARTTLTYTTASGTPSAYVLAPHQRTGDQPERQGCDLGTYPSVLGDLELCAGSVLEAFAPTVAPTGSLDLSALDDTRRTAIADQVGKDVAATGAFPSDTYFGAKALYRAATLVVLGEQVGAGDAVAELRTRVADALREWAQPDGCEVRSERCFVYDETARSVIGLTPSFGSDELNDHHFHYGYLLAAAGLLAADDSTLAADLSPVLNLVAQDIAAAVSTDQLPQLRSFDPWAGHSWASGTSPFADGNNQESSSEAVNAWNGLGLWATASGQDDLATEATWLASTEAASARAYWTNPDLSSFTGYTHRVVALVWGGKRDWATWFSPEPSAMLGIQLIPMSPVATYLAEGVKSEQITASVAEAAPSGPDVMFGDYLLMYQALAGPDPGLWEKALALPSTSIDDGDSRAYLLAFLAAHGS